MAYKLDPYDNSIVIDGFQNGVADSPFDGLSDIRNCNIISVPGEASVNFSTAKISSGAFTLNVLSSDASADTITYSNTPNLEARFAVVFSASTIGGVSTSTVYWLGNVNTSTNTSCQLYADYQLNSLVNITSNGTGTATVVTLTGAIKYYAKDLPSDPSIASSYYGIDSTGRVWSNVFTTGTNNYWIYLGNSTLTNANGNGLTAYTTDNGTTGDIYIFAFRNGLIDYLKNPLSNGSVWVYGWNPSSGTTGNTGTVLKTAAGNNISHEAMVAPDSRVYFCDDNWVDVFYQTSTGTNFDPTNTASYTWSQYGLLPTTDRAQCLTFLGTNILIGGIGNVIYPWDRFSSNFSYPILISEYNIKKLVTVNTNTFIFVGNRGRIYITNGTNAQLYKKIPDHISGTVEPYFTWGGATSIKNQLYFSASVTTNAGTAIIQYGGVWAVDLDTKAIRLTNKLSYDTYAGYATALIPNFGSNPAGTGLFIGWDDGSSGYGIDTTSSNPYTNSQATIDTDLIPIGTFESPKDFQKVEYKLTKPLVAGESVVLKTRKVFDTQSTGYTSIANLSGTTGDYSGIGDCNFKNAQWIQLQIVLNSTVTNPSYTRLKEIRIKK